ncbi:uncharacterized protein LOC128230562 isoform X2 [Mya arenaria]|uniref:uncharacterized protein LOC128230562 isoform X2 n=1 Tax=Mya arenaria TaxID=6604 RepID=UPI0022E7698A|nr:uncharacterized protein LOC128230562 isoform X2 [Mya arenaria]
MEFKRFIIPSSFYPRYFYFHQRLRRFVPKFQEIVEKNDFAKCTLFGPKHMEDILKAFDQFNEKVEVFVGRDDAINEEMFTWKELIVEDNSMDDGAVRESVRPRWSGASCFSRICVVLVNNTTIEKWQDSFCGEKGLIFYNTDDSRYMTEDTKLNKLIQAELETRVISLFESVYSFINKLIPRGCKEFSDLTQQTSSIDKSKPVKRAIHEVVREHAKKEPEKKDKSAFIFAIKTVVLKKTRATFCEGLSRACCLPQSVILDFQGVNFFDVEKKIMELEVHNLIDVTSSDERKLMKIGMELVSFIVQGLQDIEHKFVKFMKEQIVSISMLSRKQFELTGFLRSTNVQIDVLLPTILKIPRELQYKLLQNHPDVTGCGHRHGKFVIDVKKALAEKDKESIRRAMKEKNFNFDFESEVIRYVKHSGFWAEQGKTIRAQKTHDDPLSFKLGSLGCFMKKEIDSQDRLLGITCGHCVSGCDESVDVYIDHGKQFRPLGKVQYNSAQNCHEDEFLDIATIEITLNKKYVKTELKRSDGRDAKTWDVFNGELPVGLDVYKHTCQKKYDGNKESSGITLGRIISLDYIDKSVMEVCNEIEGKCKTIYELPGPYVVHIQSTMDEPFSVNGDSGAVICADDMNSVQNVHVIALLTGAVERRISTNGPLQYIFSKGSVFHELLNIVKIRENIQLLPV